MTDEPVLSRFIGYLPHGGALRRPASGRSFRPGMSPPRGFCGGSHGSAARSRCWCGCASNVRGKAAVGQRFLNAVLNLLGRLLQLHRSQLGNHGFRLLTGGFLALLHMDGLKHFRYNFDLGFGHNRENIAVEMHGAALVFGIREHLAHGAIERS